MILPTGINGLLICSIHAIENFSGSCNVDESTSTLSPSKLTKKIGGSDGYFLISVISGGGVLSPIPNSLLEQIFGSQKLTMGSCLHLY
jgi:hypothetical protein